MALLELQDVEVRYPGRRGDPPVTAVAGVSLTLEPGQVVGLVGESGCGKSSLARAAVGLVEPASGRIVFDGEPVQGLEAGGSRTTRQTRLQMVFQDPYSALNPRRRVGDQIADALVINGRAGRHAIRQRVAELMHDVGLPPESARRFPSQFSGGQRQRIVLARALAASPSAFVLDEPFASLDASSQAQIMALLDELRARETIAMLLISHDLGVVRQTADAVAVMYLGRIVETAATDALWDQPLHPYTRALIAAIPSVSDVGRRPEPLPGEVPDPSAPPPGCPFHTRCPHAFERCRTERPPLSPVAEDRTVACWLHEPATRRDARAA